eukprot:jgi/Mesvir1/7043/Mv09162-RA.2
MATALPRGPSRALAEILEQIQVEDADTVYTGLCAFREAVSTGTKQGLLREYVLLSPQCAELIRLWEAQHNANNHKVVSALLLLVTTMLQHKPEPASRQVDEATRLLESRLNDLARHIVRLRLKHVYGHLSSENRQRANLALLLLAAIVPPLAAHAATGVPPPPPDGPLIAALLRRLVPPALSKGVMSRALQHTSLLVKYVTLCTLSHVLAYAGAILQEIHHAAAVAAGPSLCVRQLSEEEDADDFQPVTASGGQGQGSQGGPPYNAGARETDGKGGREGTHGKCRQGPHMDLHAGSSTKQTPHWPGLARRSGDGGGGGINTSGGGRPSAIPPSGKAAGRTGRDDADNWWIPATSAGGAREGGASLGALGLDDERQAGMYPTSGRGQSTLGGESWPGGLGVPDASTAGPTWAAFARGLREGLRAQLPGAQTLVALHATLDAQLRAPARSLVDPASRQAAVVGGGLAAGQGEDEEEGGKRSKKGTGEKGEKGEKAKKGEKRKQPVDSQGHELAQASQPGKEKAVRGEKRPLTAIDENGEAGDAPDVGADALTGGLRGSDAARDAGDVLRTSQMVFHRTVALLAAFQRHLPETLADCRLDAPRLLHADMLRFPPLCQLATLDFLLAAAAASGASSPLAAATVAGGGAGSSAFADAGVAVPFAGDRGTQRILGDAAAAGGGGAAGYAEALASLAAEPHAHWLPSPGQLPPSYASPPYLLTLLGLAMGSPFAAVRERARQLALCAMANVGVVDEGADNLSLSIATGSEASLWLHHLPLLAPATPAAATAKDRTRRGTGSDEDADEDEEGMAGVLPQGGATNPSALPPPPPHPVAVFLSTALSSLSRRSLHYQGMIEGTASHLPRQGNGVGRDGPAMAGAAENGASGKEGRMDKVVGGRGLLLYAAEHTNGPSEAAGMEALLSEGVASTTAGAGMRVGASFSPLVVCLLEDCQRVLGSVGASSKSGGSKQPTGAGPSAGAAKGHVDDEDGAKGASASEGNEGKDVQHRQQCLMLASYTASAALSLLRAQRDPRLLASVICAVLATPPAAKSHKGGLDKGAGDKGAEGKGGGNKASNDGDKAARSISGDDQASVDDGPAAVLASAGGVPHHFCMQGRHAGALAQGSAKEAEIAPEWGPLASLWKEAQRVVAATRVVDDLSTHAEGACGQGAPAGDSRASAKHARSPRAPETYAAQEGDDDGISMPWLNKAVREQWATLRKGLLEEVRGAATGTQQQAQTEGGCTPRFAAGHTGGGLLGQELGDGGEPRSEGKKKHKKARLSGALQVSALSIASDAARPSPPGASPSSPALPPGKASSALPLTHRLFCRLLRAAPQVVAWHCRDVASLCRDQLGGDLSPLVMFFRARGEMSVLDVPGASTAMETADAWAALELASDTSGVPWVVSNPTAGQSEEDESEGALATLLLALPFDALVAAVASSVSSQTPRKGGTAASPSPSKNSSGLSSERHGPQSAHLSGGQGPAAALRFLSGACALRALKRLDPRMWPLIMRSLMRLAEEVARSTELLTGALDGISLAIQVLGDELAGACQGQGRHKYSHGSVSESWGGIASQSGIMGGQGGRSTHVIGQTSSSPSLVVLLECWRSALLAALSHPLLRVGFMRGSFAQDAWAERQEDASGYSRELDQAGDVRNAMDLWCIQTTHELLEFAAKFPSSLPGVAAVCKEHVAALCQPYLRTCLRMAITGASSPLLSASSKLQPGSGMAKGRPSSDKVMPAAAGIDAGNATEADDRVSPALFAVLHVARFLHPADLHALLLSLASLPPAMRWWWPTQATPQPSPSRLVGSATRTATMSVSTASPAGAPGSPAPSAGPTAARGDASTSPTEPMSAQQAAVVLMFTRTLLDAIGRNGGNLPLPPLLTGAAVPMSHGVATRCAPLVTPLAMLVDAYGVILATTAARYSDEGDRCIRQALALAMSLASPGQALRGIIPSYEHEYLPTRGHPRWHPQQQQQQQQGQPAQSELSYCDLPETSPAWVLQGLMFRQAGRKGGLRGFASPVASASLAAFVSPTAGSAYQRALLAGYLCSAADAAWLTVAGASSTTHNLGNLDGAGAVTAPGGGGGGGSKWGMAQQLMILPAVRALLDQACVVPEDASVDRDDSIKFVRGGSGLSPASGSRPTSTPVSGLKRGRGGMAEIAEAADGSGRVALLMGIRGVPRGPHVLLRIRDLYQEALLQCMLQPSPPMDVTNALTGDAGSGGNAGKRRHSHQATGGDEREKKVGGKQGPEAHAGAGDGTDASTSLEAVLLRHLSRALWDGEHAAACRAAVMREALPVLTACLRLHVLTAGMRHGGAQADLDSQGAVGDAGRDDGNNAAHEAPSPDASIVSGLLRRLVPRKGAWELPSATDVARDPGRAGWDLWRVAARAQLAYALLWAGPWPSSSSGLSGDTPAGKNVGLHGGPETGRHSVATDGRKRQQGADGRLSVAACATEGGKEGGKEGDAVGGKDEAGGSGAAVSGSDVSRFLRAVMATICALYERSAAKVLPGEAPTPPASPTMAVAPGTRDVEAKLWQLLLKSWAAFWAHNGTPVGTTATHSIATPHGEDSARSLLTKLLTSLRQLSISTLRHRFAVAAAIRNLRLLLESLPVTSPAPPPASWPASAAAAEGDNALSSAIRHLSSELFSLLALHSQFPAAVLRAPYGVVLPDATVRGRHSTASWPSMGQPFSSEGSGMMTGSATSTSAASLSMSSQGSLSSLFPFFEDGEARQATGGVLVEGPYLGPLHEGAPRCPPGEGGAGGGAGRSQDAGGKGAGGMAGEGPGTRHEIVRLLCLLQQLRGEDADMGDSSGDVMACAGATAKVSAGGAGRASAASASSSGATPPGNCALEEGVIVVLLAAYGGTLWPSDRGILWLLLALDRQCMAREARFGQGGGRGTATGSRLAALDFLWGAGDPRRVAALRWKLAEMRRARGQDAGGGADRSMWAPGFESQGEHIPLEVRLNTFRELALLEPRRCALTCLHYPGARQMPPACPWVAQPRPMAPSPAAAHRVADGSDTKELRGVRGGQAPVSVRNASHAKYLHEGEEDEEEEDGSEGGQEDEEGEGEGDDADIEVGGCDADEDMVDVEDPSGHETGIGPRGAGHPGGAPGNASATAGTQQADVLPDRDLVEWQRVREERGGLWLGRGGGDDGSPLMGLEGHVSSHWGSDLSSGADVNYYSSRVGYSAAHDDGESDRIAAVAGLGHALSPALCYPAYDPVFLLALALHALTVPLMDAREFARSGLLASAVASLSAQSDSLRGAAYAVLAKYAEVVKEASFREKPQVGLLLRCLQNSITVDGQRIPSVSCLFVAEAAAAVMHPEAAAYVSINKFLLNRPMLDLQDVPLFYAKLFSGDASSYRSDRVWMLRLLARGLVSSRDGAIFRRRFVLEMLMAFHESSLADAYARWLVLQVIRSAIAIPRCASDLLASTGLVAWLASATCASLAALTTSTTRAAATPSLHAFGDPAIAATDAPTPRVLPGSEVGCAGLALNALELILASRHVQRRPLPRAPSDPLEPCLAAACQLLDALTSASSARQLIRGSTIASSQYPSTAFPSQGMDAAPPSMGRAGGRLSLTLAGVVALPLLRFVAGTLRAAQARPSSSPCGGFSLRVPQLLALLAWAEDAIPADSHLPTDHLFPGSAGDGDGSDVAHAGHATSCGHHVNASTGGGLGRHASNGGVSRGHEGFSVDKALPTGESDGRSGRDSSGNNPFASLAPVALAVLSVVTASSPFCLSSRGEVASFRHVALASLRLSSKVLTSGTRARHGVAERASLLGEATAVSPPSGVPGAEVAAVTLLHWISSALLRSSSWVNDDRSMAGVATGAPPSSNDAHPAGKQRDASPVAASRALGHGAGGSVRGDEAAGPIVPSSLLAPLVPVLVPAVLGLFRSLPLAAARAALPAVGPLLVRMAAVVEACCLARFGGLATVTARAGSSKLSKRARDVGMEAGDEDMEGNEEEGEQEEEEGQDLEYEEEEEEEEAEEEEDAPEDEDEDMDEEGGPPVAEGGGGDEGVVDMDSGEWAEEHAQGRSGSAGAIAGVGGRALAVGPLSQGWLSGPLVYPVYRTLRVHVLPLLLAPLSLPPPLAPHWKWDPRSIHTSLTDGTSDPQAKGTPSSAGGNSRASDAFLLAHVWELTLVLLREMFAGVPPTHFLHLLFKWAAAPSIPAPTRTRPGGVNARSTAAVELHSADNRMTALACRIIETLRMQARAESPATTQMGGREWSLSHLLQSAAQGLD